MRIAYLCFEDFSGETGVAKKICLQAQHWKRAGHDVALIAPKMRGERIEAADGLEIREFDFPLGTKKYLDPNGMGIREIRKFQPDIIYNRYFILPPWHLSLAKQFSLVFEVNSEESEFALYHSRPKRLLHATWRKKFLKSAAGAVFISKELSQKRDYDLLKNRVVIANGIDRPQVENHDDYERTPGPARLFFLGNGNFPWHGVDKICQLARHLPDAKFDIVGDPTINDCPPNVIRHGPLPKNSYLELLHQADIAIGPLSLHTKALTEASPLKIREYLSCGIPTIVAYNDTDISASTPLTLHIPNTADNVSTSLAAITSFIESAKGKRIAWETVSDLDAERKESQRLEFFGSCLTNNVRCAA
jgi:glycosyltransferase involved in cell wall biosynthesis